MPEARRATLRTTLRGTLTARVLTVLLAVCAAPATAADTLQGITVEPRAFGYHVGDLVEREVVVHAPEGFVLDEATLPRPGARGKAVELRHVSRRSEAESGGTRHRLLLTYQVFVSPTEVRTLEIAPFSLGFKGEGREQGLRIDAWPVTVSPLVPVDVSPRNGLGEMRPDVAPPLIDTRPSQRRLVLYGAVLLLCLAYLAQVYVALPWWGRRKRPFANAWRQLGGLPADSPAPERRAAFQRVHEALNQTAGEVLFEQGVERFVAAQPRYAGLRADLLAFFRESRREFFAEGDPAAGDSRWLVEFCRKCRDAERGAA
jgi:mxaA protein